jgi:hypothetical protein
VGQQILLVASKDSTYTCTYGWKGGFNLNFKHLK